MEIVIDVVIGLAAFVAAAYCLVLSRRLRALTRLDGDLGRAIAILSQQVDGLTTALTKAQSSSEESGKMLAAKIAEAETTARRLELLMAAYRPPESPATARSMAEASAPDGDDFTPRIRAPKEPERGRRILRSREPKGVVS